MQKKIHTPPTNLLWIISNPKLTRGENMAKLETLSKYALNKLKKISIGDAGHDSQLITAALLTIAEEIYSLKISLRVVLDKIAQKI